MSCIEVAYATSMQLTRSFLAPFKFPQGGSLKQPCPCLYLYLFDLNLCALARLLTFGLCVLWSHDQEWKTGSTKDVFGDAAHDQPSQTSPSVCGHSDHIEASGRLSTPGLFCLFDNRSGYICTDCYGRGDVELEGCKGFFSQPF